MQTRIYVDGFNLYYGAIRDQPGTRWLDLDALCRKLLKPENVIEHIHYCTAHVAARAKDEDQPLRQQLYLRALRTIPHLTITLGRFLTNDVRMARVSESGEVHGTVLVRKTEEKGSDVNLATLLLKEGFQDLYDVAVVISNDSDLVLPIQVVRSELGKKVGVYSPYKRASFYLSKAADFYRPIRAGVMKASQFPEVLTDAGGAFRKPPSW